MEHAVRRPIAPFLALSIALHAAMAGALLHQSGGTPPEPPVLRVTLLRMPAEPAPGPPEPIAAPPAPAPAPPVAKTPPRSPRPIAPKPAPPAPVTPAVAVAPEPVAAPIVEPEVATGGPAGVDVAAAPARVAGAIRGGADGAGQGAGDLVSAYIAQVRTRIAAHKRYPSAARSRGIVGTVIALVVIGRDGTLEEVLLEGAPALLATSTREAILAAAPFDPPPDGARRIRIPVRYDLSD